MNQNKKTLIGIGVGFLLLGLLAGVWALLDYREGTTKTPATSTRVLSLQADNQILDEYRNHDFRIEETWLREAGFDLKKRLYPAKDTSGVIRFKLPTEYFEVGLSTDNEKGVSGLNIVAASARESGATEKISKETLDELFEKGEREGSYDEVRTLPDGRVKAEIASEGCLVTASGYEKAKVRTFTEILLSRCSEILQ